MKYLYDYGRFAASLVAITLDAVVVFFLVANATPVG